MANALHNTTTHGGLLFIHAQTALHPGSGTTLGTVDLPIQRERHTRWPTIAGSALKGVLRDAYRELVAQGRMGNAGPTTRQEANENDSDLVSIFGPGKPDESSAHAGALTVTDARILAFPVRSLTGVFAWVTCQSALERLCRDLSLVGLTPPELPPIWPAEQGALMVENSPVCDDRSQEATIVLEEFDFKFQGSCDEVAQWLAENAVSDKYTRERLAKHLVVLHDNAFSHYVQYATEIVARIALDYERKTVKQGALFYQEFLPAETLMYAVLISNSSRKSESTLAAQDILHKVKECLTKVPILQIGGDETTGKGLCRVHILS